MDINIQFTSNIIYEIWLYFKKYDIITASAKSARKRYNMGRKIWKLLQKRKESKNGISRRAF